MIIDQKNRIVMRRPDDFHVHFRQDEVFSALVREHASVCGRVVDIPNTTPPIATKDDIMARRRLFARAAVDYPHFRPLLCAYLTPETRASMVAELWIAGADGFKYLPVSKARQAGTTNAHWGLHPEQLLDDDRAELFDRMAEDNQRLRVHAEHPDYKKGEREKRFLPILEKVMRRHPRLRVVFEHISSAEGVAFVKAHPTMLATVTAHHMLLTWEDGYGDHDHCCMPAIKTEPDRIAVFEFARDSEQAAYGSDSAPHSREAKAQVVGASGIFVPPRVGVPAVVGLFEREGCLDKVEPFFSERGARWNGLPLNEDTITLTRTPWTVPDEIAGFRPLFAGQTLDRQIAG